MAQHDTSTQPVGRRDEGRPTETMASQLVEKGWTVYDAAEHPLGNVSDVDHAAGRLVIDGRPVGYGTFDVPLSAVRRTGDNEVHLALTIDAGARAAGATPRLTERGEASQRGAGAVLAPGLAGTTTGATTTTRDTATTRRGGPAPVWTEGDGSRGWSGTTIALTTAALGGLGAAGYYYWRRRQRKSALARFLDTAGGFARDRHPAWWAGLAAATLPIAYYAWPSDRSAAEQARERLPDMSGWRGMLPGQQASWLDTLTGRLPSTGDLWSDSETSPGWDLALPGALLALSGLALYLASRRRRGEHLPTRIADVMTHRPQVVRPDASLTEAAAMMRRLDVGALPVCDGSRLVGMITDRDIAIRAAADGRDPHTTLVRDVMSPEITWAVDTDPVEEAARIMREHQIRRLPVVDERHNLVGIVSLGDLAVDIESDQLSGETLERVSEPARPRR